MAEFRDRVKELRWVPASELRANPRNWRQHPPSQKAALEGLLRELGYVVPVTAYDTPNGLTLIDGHLRLEVMIELFGLDCRIPVNRVDATDNEADKMMVTIDPLAAMANADQDALLSLLRDATFQDQAVNDLLEAIANGERLPMPDLTEPKEDPGPQMDRAEELRDKWQTERGQLWEIGPHRLMCGDSSVQNDVDMLMAGTSVEVLWTDPPYGVSYVGGTPDALTLPNDDPLWIGHLLSAVFEVIDPFMVPGCRVYLAAPPGPLNVVFRFAFTGAGWSFHEGLIWVKDSMVLGHSDYHLRHEDILYGWKPGEGRVGRGNHPGSRWYGDHSQTSVFEISRPRRSQEHPTMKPPELVYRQLQNSSQQGDVILDPFLGSGTTMVAAEQLGRVCYAMDISEKYVAVALERMARMGLEPRLADAQTQ